MRTEIIWSQRAGQGEVYGMVCTSDGEKLFAVSDNKVKVITPDGEVLRTIDTPHTRIANIAAHPTDQKIVTVGMDNQVIFMDASGTALFKYGHNTEIQCCAFSPDGKYFLTGADGDIGIYSNGAQRVNKIRTDQLVRAVAWSPTSQWFVIANESGLIQFLDVEGKEFNRCECGAPIWQMKVVNEKFFKKTAETEDDEEPEIALNDVGIYGMQKEAALKNESEFKQNPTAEAFIKQNKVNEERLLMISWDQKYRVINPGSLAHSGVLIQQKRLFSGSKKQKKLQDKENPFLISESRIPFIPLSFELIKQYAVVGGVGGKVIILNAETGACLLDMFQVNELDPFIVQCPRSVLVKRSVQDQAQYKEALQKAMKEREEHTLSYFGLNNTQIYSMCKIEPNLLVIGLHNGIVLCLRFHFNAVDAVYKNFYAVREGLTQIVVKNMTTNSECRMDVGAYVQNIAISNTKLVVMSGQKLDVYSVKDGSAQKRAVESVLRQEHQRAKKGAIVLEFVKQHQIRFKCKKICVASEHFIICGHDYVTALTFEGTHTTSWRFKDTIINCCKVIGGITGQENIIIGTQDGRALLLKIGNRFPIEAVKHHVPIVNVDVNAHRNLIAIVDSNDKMYVFDYFSGNFRSTAAQEPIYSLQNIQTCSFDLVLPNVIAVSSGQKIHLCIDGTIVYTHTVSCEKATIVIQNGSANYNVNWTKAQEGFGINCIDTTEVPMTPNVTHHVKKVFQFLAAGVTDFEFYEELDMALQAAALGVPVSYWMDIAVASLFAGQVKLAKEALSMIGNVRALKILAEVEQMNKSQQQFQYVALALSLVGNFADAAMLYGATGDSQTATELLYFTRQDGLLDIGPFTSLIGAITQKLINKLLTEFSQKSGVSLSELNPLPNLSLYFKLGSSEEDMKKFRSELLENSKKQNKSNKYLDFLQIYEQQPVQSGQQIQKAQYQYSQDFRIMLRRELQALTPNVQHKQELLSKHARFLEQVSDWQAASSSWMDAGDCEKAVQVLINNRQTNTLLRLVRILPPVNQKKQKKNDLEDDFDYEARKDDQVNNQNLISAFQMVLKYFEAIGDFESALFIAQRLGDQLALLRLFVSQNLWDNVEDLGKIYPEMLPAIHEARAAAYLREGNFMAALARLRMAGNNEKEVAMIRALIDAATVECKFDMARSLVCQLQQQMIMQKGVGQPYYGALKALRSKILIMSAYVHLMQHLYVTFGSPDPANMRLMDLDKAQQANPFIISICTFLCNYSMLPQEIAKLDEVYLQKFESMEFQDQTSNKLQVQETNQFVNSNSKPQLGSLSQLDLGNSQRSLPPGIPEALVWLALSQASKVSPKLNYVSMQHLLQMRLPQSLYTQIRKNFMKAKPAGLRTKPDEICDRCPRCNQQLDIIQQQVLTQRDMDILLSLPMCSPSLSDICKKCGTPIVRSAISLQILPLIPIEPSEDSSIMELIEKVSSVRIADAHGQVIRVDDGLMLQNLQQVLREAPVVEDGRGVVLPREFYDQIGPTRAFIVNDSAADPVKFKELAVDGVVKRVYVITDENADVHFCQKCEFFFQSDEFEEAFVMTGKCPVCQNEDLMM
ncbi:Intraflagellar_transport protein 122 [Hexamita inflata]|uniref:Intraflagellar transport protein 122 n=1 Tax=Hexamita inflata TaxID=28002 RepID=A0AA86N4L6_9EUKA|nr:Intraflagellar transport protein 122 [Hexamita inflata]